MLRANHARKGLHPLVYQVYKIAKTGRATRPPQEETARVLHAATAAITDAFTPDDLSVLAWSVSKMGLGSPSFWRVVINLTEAYSRDFTHRASARMLEAFAGSGDHSGCRSAAVSALVDQLRDPPPPEEGITSQGVCQFLRALVKLKRVEEIPPWLIQQGLRHLGSQETANGWRSLVPLMWPLSRIPTSADEAVTIVVLLIRGGKLDYTQMTTTDVALLVHAMAKAWNTSSHGDCDAPPPYRDVLSMLVTECGVRGWKGLSPHAIAGVMWACGRCCLTSLLDECSDDWHPLMGVELKDFDPQALANFLWGIGRINRKQLPSWLPPSSIEASVSHQNPKADLFSLSMTACALAYEQNADVDSLFDTLWRCVRDLVHRRAHSTDISTGAGDLAALLWAFSRRGHMDAVREITSLCRDHLQSLPADLRALALWGMAHAGLVLPPHIGKDILARLHEDTMSSSTTTSIVALGQLCPTLDIPLPPLIQCTPASDLWRLATVRNASVEERRSALSLALRRRTDYTLAAAAHYANCMDPQSGFLYPSRLRLNVLQNLVRSVDLAKSPPRHLPLLACYLAGIAQRCQPAMQLVSVRF